MRLLTYYRGEPVVLQVRRPPSIDVRRGDKAWIGVGVGVLAYQLSAPQDELMSEAMDRYLEAHPWITNAAVAAVALHLLNRLPLRLDPLHGFGLMARR